MAFEGNDNLKVRLPIVHQTDGGHAIQSANDVVVIPFGNVYAFCQRNGYPYDPSINGAHLDLTAKAEQNAVIISAILSDLHEWHYSQARYSPRPIAIPSTHSPWQVVGLVLLMVTLARVGGMFINGLFLIAAFVYLWVAGICIAIHKSHVGSAAERQMLILTQQAMSESRYIDVNKLSNISRLFGMFKLRRACNSRVN